MSFNSSSFAQSAHTLPRNFTFHYQDGEPPRTPEPSDTVFPQRTSPPPMPPARALREPYRLRRRRAPFQASQRAIRAINNDNSDAFGASQDVPLPSIELTDAAGSRAELPQAMISAPRPFSPPRTPAAQIYGVEPTEGPDVSSSQEDLTRPSTACSGSSTSSKSSSLESFPSLGAACASPKLEADPYTSAAPIGTLISSPLQDYGFPMAPGFVLNKPSFTQEMDDHLWITYMRYLQDPTHTPFKMLPGTAPPPGVCSRVVREAKRTWKGSMTSAIPKVHRFARWGTSRTESVDETLSLAPGGFKDRRGHISWPRSDSATRKRLRDLCKLKPTLSAHYGRLLHARSPSPFVSSSSVRGSSVSRDVLSPGPRTTAPSFGTRDLNISLATSVATTMQPSHPLAQMSSEAAIERPPPSILVDPTEEMTTPRPRAVTHQHFSTAPRTPSHQKSMSMQEGSSRGLGPRPLASPFRPLPAQTAKPTRSHDFLQSAVSVARPSSSSLEAPAELHAPVPRRSFFKRPAPGTLNDMMNSEDPFTRQTHLMRELFGPPQQQPEVSHRRVRSRGFSLGDMTASSRLESLFATAPPEQALPASSSLPQLVQPSSLLPPPSIASIARLGSPFAEKPATKTHFNTFPRNFSLPGLEPAMEITEDRPEEPMPNAEQH